MEGPTKNPLELACGEAAEIIQLMREDKESFMEERLLEAHLEKCEDCQKKMEGMEQEAE